MSDRPYHHGALEAALVDAAVAAVRAGGLGALVVRDLARSIGVSPSAAYRHFPSRDHLQARVAQVGREELARSLLAARDVVTARGSKVGRAERRLTAIGRAYVGFALDNPNLFDAAFARCDVGAPTPDDPDAWQVLVDVVDELVDAGGVPTSQRNDAPLIAWASVHGLATILTASVTPPTLDAMAHATRAVDAVVDGVVRAIS